MRRTACFWRSRTRPLHSAGRRGRTGDPRRLLQEVRAKAAAVSAAPAAIRRPTGPAYGERLSIAARSGSSGPGAFWRSRSLFYAIVRFYPTLEAFWVSFHGLGADRRAQTSSGSTTICSSVADPLFWKVFRNTFAYLLIGTPIRLVISFTIAYHLDRVRFMHGFIRALYFLPFLTTAAAMAWVWRWFYQPLPVGVINNVLVELRHPAAAVPRLHHQALPAVLATAIWAGLGFQIDHLPRRPARDPAAVLRSGAHRRRRANSRSSPRSPFRC